MPHRFRSLVRAQESKRRFNRAQERKEVAYMLAGIFAGIVLIAAVFHDLFIL